MSANPPVAAERPGLLDRMLRIDRRWIFLFVAVAVAAPLFFHISLKIPITPEVRGVYDFLEKLPPDSRVLLACDYDPGSYAEVQPMTVTFMKYAFTHKLRVIIMGLWPQGPQQADLAVQDALAVPAIAALHPEYGVDYINLGYQAGNEVVIQRMGSNIPAVFPRDWRGVPVEQFPIMEGVRDFNSIAYVFNVSAGYPGTIEWVQFAGDRFHTPIGTGTVAVQAPQIYPYFPTQLTGVLGGMKGAAEFEEITGFPAKAVTYMASQSDAHVVVVIFIIIGNTAFFLSRRRSRRTGRGGAGA